MARPERPPGTELRVGRLTKAHGLKGALKLDLYTDDPARRFVPGATFALQVPDSSPWHGQRLELVELKWFNGVPVGFFAGVTDRTAAEGLVKAIVTEVDVAGGTVTVDPPGGLFEEPGESGAEAAGETP